ncbi:beta transducin [Balamuthia mandrillaris]
MVRSYLRYALRDTFGVISSSDCNVIYDASGELAVSGALEGVALWQLKTGQQRGNPLRDLEEESLIDKYKGEAVSLCRAPDGVHIAAGYADGTIRVWNLRTRACDLTLNGHKSAVTALCYHASSSLLVSGSKDTDIIVWDMLAETGLFRLRGHRDQITRLHLLKDRRLLLSSSKDALMKVWDLDTQHCVQTVVGHRSEIWSFDVSPDERLLVSGSSGSNLRLYRLLHLRSLSDEGAKATGGKPRQQKNKQKAEEEEEEEEGDDKEKEEEKVVELIGELPRQEAKERVVQVQFSPDGSMLGCLAANNWLELYNVNSEEKIQHKIKKRKSRLKKKQKQKNGMDVVPAEEDGDEDGEESGASQLHVEMVPTDILSALPKLRASFKAHSFDFSPSKQQVLLALQNNVIEAWDLKNKKGKKKKDTAKTEEKEYQQASSIELPGHRSDIRSVALSDDDTLLLSTSNNMVKVWNIESLQCIRTLESGYGLCGAFVPGNRHVIIGTKAGTIELYDLASSTCLQLEEAHNGAVWSISINPDQTGFVSASADQTVQFWDFELVQDDAFSKTSKRLGIKLTQTLEMTDQVLCVKQSKDNKFLAVSLLDNSIKVFFRDTLKFFLSLYGHKLPVMSLDISSDSTLLVSGSADKNIKIWGLDFGDCHKSIYAHEDSVMQVQFVPDTHHFFSVGKDKLLKYWDADKFEHVMTLPGHHAEVWCLAVNKTGTFVVTASHDRSLRIWEQTDEPLFLQEQRDNEMEELFEKAIEEPLERGVEDKSETGSAGKRTIATVKAAERLGDAVTLAEEESNKRHEYLQELAEAEKVATPEEIEEKTKKGLPLIAPPTANILLGGKSPSEYLLGVLKGIRSSELEEALLVLPFTTVLTFFKYLNEWMREGKDIDLCSRCLFFLLRIHQSQIVANKSLLSVLQSLRANTRKRIQTQKDVMGFNRAAMRFLKQDMEQSVNATFFEDAALKLRQTKSKNKKKKTNLFA